jgi:hypothetical protein
MFKAKNPLTAQRDKVSYFTGTSERSEQENLSKNNIIFLAYLVSKKTEDAD